MHYWKNMKNLNDIKYLFFVLGLILFPTVSVGIMCVAMSGQACNNIIYYLSLQVLYTALIRYLTYSLPPDIQDHPFALDGSYVLHIDWTNIKYFLRDRDASMHRCLKLHFLRARCVMLACSPLSLACTPGHRVTLSHELPVHIHFVQIGSRVPLVALGDQSDGDCSLWCPPRLCTRRCHFG